MIKKSHAPKESKAPSIQPVAREFSAYSLLFQRYEKILCIQTGESKIILPYYAH
jgi:hypothetical protein